MLVGSAVGCGGMDVGAGEAVNVAVALGVLEGVLLGVFDGVLEGVLLGVFDGVFEGVLLGVFDGVLLGVLLGVLDGVGEYSGVSVAVNVKVGVGVSVDNCSAGTTLDGINRAANSSATATKGRNQFFIR